MEFDVPTIAGYLEQIDALVSEIAADVAAPATSSEAATIHTVLVGLADAAVTAHGEIQTFSSMSSDVGKPVDGPFSSMSSDAGKAGDDRAFSSMSSDAVLNEIETNVQAIHTLVARTLSAVQVARIRTALEALLEAAENAAEEIGGALAGG